MTSESQQVAAGKLEAHVDDLLFDGSFDDLNSFSTRKRAMSHPLRYAILYYLYETHRGGEESVTRGELGRVTGRETSGNDLQSVLRPLVEVDLLEQVPAPEGVDGRRTYYRLTTLGRQAIEADLDHLR
jgi:DNA-binding MarR family transcriptional regulator